MTRVQIHTKSPKLLLPRAKHVCCRINTPTKRSIFTAVCIHLGFKRRTCFHNRKLLCNCQGYFFFFLAGTGMETKRPSHMHESRRGERHGDDGCQVRVKGRSGEVGCTKLNFNKCTRTFKPHKKMLNFDIFAFVRLLSRSSDLLPQTKDTHTRFIS